MGKRAGAAALAAALALSGCVHLGSVETAVETSAAYTDDRGPVQMVSTMVGVKNVFIPSTVVVTEGAGRSLSIFNTTDIPHGFAIPALGISIVLEPGQETVVALPTLEGGRIYDIGCHLHAPHRHATLMVVHARK